MFAHGLLILVLVFSSSEATSTASFEDLFTDLEEIALHIVQLVREIPEYGDYLRTIKACSWNMTVSVEERVEMCKKDGREFEEMFPEAFETSVQESVQKIADVHEYFVQRYFPSQPELATQLISHFYTWFLKKPLAEMNDDQISGLLMIKLQRYISAQS